MLRGIIQRRPLVSYAVLATVICSLSIAWQVALSTRNPALLHMIPDYLKWLALNHLYTNALTIGRFGIEGHPAAFLIFLYSGAPALAAIVISALAWGRRGVAKLFARLKPWTRPQDRDRALKSLRPAAGGLRLRHRRTPLSGARPRRSGLEPSGTSEAPGC